MNPTPHMKANAGKLLEANVRGAFLHPGLGKCFLDKTQEALNKHKK